MKTVIDYQVISACITHVFSASVMQRNTMDDVDLHFDSGGMPDRGSRQRREVLEQISMLSHID
jgi:hypothetical protein